jgi:hypothetical protein
MEVFAEALHDFGGGTFFGNLFVLVEAFADVPVGFDTDVGDGLEGLFAAFFDEGLEVGDEGLVIGLGYETLRH